MLAYFDLAVVTLRVGLDSAGPTSHCRTPMGSWIYVDLPLWRCGFATGPEHNAGVTGRSSSPAPLHHWRLCGSVRHAGVRASGARRHLGMGYLWPTEILSCEPTSNNPPISVPTANAIYFRPYLNTLVSILYIHLYNLPLLTFQNPSKQITPHNL